MKIALLGCGWLGLPLGERLVKEGFKVSGTTTTDSKLALLKAKGIEPFLLDLASVEPPENMEAFLLDADVLVITVPPKQKSADFDFFAALEFLLREAVRHNIKKLLFTSSISVYEDTPDFREYTEADAPLAKKGRGEQLLWVEALLKNTDPIQACVLRLGGLLGKDRHPVKFLSGRRNIKNPKAPVNLVQQKDCVEVMTRIIKEDQFGETYNVVYPYHPSREEYYVKEARKQNLSLPEFDPAPSKGKLISSAKLQRELNFRFEEGI